ncbi:MAG: hypothetical protein AB1646_05910 [Thermodesulfobacteriota bacterium]
MSHPVHEPVVSVIRKATSLMDDLLRGRIDVDAYAGKLKELDVEAIMVTHEEDFKKDVRLVYYLDALMLLSSLQHELDFQVAEYGTNVALEDMRCLQELEHKFPQS